MDDHNFDELETLFGPAVVMDLEHRGLLPRLRGEPHRLTDGAADRIHGALLGAAIGNGFGRRTRHLTPLDVQRRFGPRAGVLHQSTRRPELRLGAEGRLLVSWAGRLAAKGRTAAPALSERLATRRPRLEQPGAAIVETVDRLDAGAPWYAAAPDSYGNGALLRAVADGARWATDPDWRPMSAALGCLVTHAHPRAVATSVVLAELVAAGVADPDLLAQPQDLARRFADQVDDPQLTHALLLPQGQIGLGSFAVESLTRALHVVTRHADPEKAMEAAVRTGGPADVVAGVVGALLGAPHGPGAFPGRWRRYVQHADRIDRRARRLAEVQGITPSKRRRTPAPKTTGDGSEPVHIWFLVDRSGSMAPLQQAVVDGFNGFVTEQQAMPGKARLTLVQFDGRDPYEVLIDATRIEEVAPLDRRRYRPRGSTPLYDAIGSLVDAAEVRIADRARRGRPAEDQLVVIFTDGMENASRRWDRQEILARIEDKKAEGWTFAYLGANQDSFAVGASMGIAHGSSANWAPTPEGFADAGHKVSASAMTWRAKSRHARRIGVDDYFLADDEVPSGR